MPNLTDIKIPITGSKALTPSETQIQGVGATPIYRIVCRSLNVLMVQNYQQLENLIFLNTKIY